MYQGSPYPQYVCPQYQGSPYPQYVCPQYQGSPNPYIATQALQYAGYPAVQPHGHVGYIAGYVMRPVISMQPYAYGPAATGFIPASHMGAAYGMPAQVPGAPSMYDHRLVSMPAGAPTPHMAILGGPRAPPVPPPRPPPMPPPRPPPVPPPRPPRPPADSAAAGNATTATKQQQQSTAALPARAGQEQQQTQEEQDTDSDEAGPQTHTQDAMQPTQLDQTPAAATADPAHTAPSQFRKGTGALAKSLPWLFSGQQAGCSNSTPAAGTAAVPDTADGGVETLPDVNAAADSSAGCCVASYTAPLREPQLSSALSTSGRPAGEQAYSSDDDSSKSDSSSSSGSRPDGGATSAVSTEYSAAFAALSQVLQGTLDGFSVSTPAGGAYDQGDALAGQTLAPAAPATGLDRRGAAGSSAARHRAKGPTDSAAATYSVTGAGKFNPAPVAQQPHNQEHKQQQQGQAPVVLRSIKLLPPPTDDAAAKNMRAEFQYALFARHSSYVLALLQPSAASKLSCLMRLSQADLAAVLDQPQPELLLDQIWASHEPK